MPHMTSRPPFTSERDTTLEIRRPEGPAAETSKYAGRALAEWSQLIDECRLFFERRRREGVPTDEKVETPLLGFDALSRR